MSPQLDIRGHSGQIARFLIVGAIGFVADALVLLLLVHVLGLSRVWSRIPSLLIAMTVTWWLHRHFTFSWARETAPSHREWLRFVFANALGNGFNLGIYWLLVGPADWGIMSALVVASVAAAAINYAMSARWVFRRA
jgi:putative flippase GtrA